MTRRIVNEDSWQKELRELVPLYADKKAILDPLKKETESINQQIKDTLVQNKQEEFDTGVYRVSISSTVKEDFNEERAIEILRKTLHPTKFASCVKTKEYLDDDLFEALVYAKEVDPAILDVCRTQKPPTITLRISKSKGGK